MISDITPAHRYQLIFQQLVEGTASVTGENFFVALVRNLAQALNVQYAMISIKQGDRLQTLAWVAHGELQPNITYTYANTPCEAALAQGELYCDSQVQARFPDDQDLVRLQAENYLGVVLPDDNGEVIGNLCVLGVEPWTAEHSEEYRKIMRIFAARASVELQRNFANKRLRNLNQSLETQIAQQTQQLVEKTQFQQAIFDSTDYYIVATDVEGVIVSVNAGAERLYGYSAAELIGKTTPLIFSDPDDLPQVLGQNGLPSMDLFLEPVRQTGRLEVELLTRHRDGRRFPLALTITPLKDSEGTVIGFLGIGKDVSREKRVELERQTAIAKLREAIQQLQLAQQEISQNNQLLKTITKAQAQFIIATDRLTIFEELLTDLLELTDSEYGFIGEVLFREDGTAAMEDSLMKIRGVPYLKTHSLTNIAWNEETQKLYEGAYQKGMEFTNMNTLFGAVIMTGKPVVANNPATDRRRGGTPKGHPPLDAFLGLPFFRGDTLMGMVGIANRPGGYSEEIIRFLEPFLITCSNLIEGYRSDHQRRQAETRLQLANEELIRATQLKDEFLANMSHELRTPLNAILGNTEILEEEIFGPINSQQVPPLNTIEKSANHLLSLINDILDVAKIESGQIKLNYSSIKIASLCSTSIAFIRPQALKKQIQLETHVPPHLPDLWGDERRVRQVLINLLNNAVKFTPEGGTISLTVAPQPSKAPHEAAECSVLRFTITDTGIGIAPNDLPKLFRPFIQIDSALNRQYDGTGLGLALVKQIVQLHGGEVNLTSQLGVGSCFTVDFPYNPTGRH